MEKEFKIVIGSPVDYKELVAYIQINEQYIALVQKEEGIHKMKVEFFEEKIRSDIYLQTLINALQEAKIQLMK